MTIRNALTFIEIGLRDAELRERLNTAPSASDIQTLLAEENLPFSAYEFDEAFHHRLTQCMTVEEASRLKEFAIWWDLLFQTFEPVIHGGTCRGCCG